MAVVQATRDLIHGKFFGGGDIINSVATGGAGFGKLDAVAKPYAGKLAKVLAKIKSGKIKNIRRPSSRGERASTSPADARSK